MVIWASEQEVQTYPTYYSLFQKTQFSNPLEFYLDVNKVSPRCVHAHLANNLGAGIPHFGKACFSFSLFLHPLSLFY